jgi:hypothetical protein
VGHNTQWSVEGMTIIWARFFSLLQVKTVEYEWSDIITGLLTEHCIFKAIERNDERIMNSEVKE